MRQSESPSAGERPHEESQLDSALLQADRLLVTSLKQQESQRRRRAIRLGMAIGGFVMIATFGLVWLLTLPSHQTVQSPHPSTPRPTLLASDTPQPTADALSREGWKLMQQQDFDGAAEKFEQAVKQNPKLAAAWNGLGWSRLNGGKPDAATTAFKHVLDIDPQHPAALNGMGQIAFAQHHFDDAEKYLLKAAPKAPAAWWGLTKIYLLQSKWPDAKKYAQKIVNAGGLSGDMADDAKGMLKAANDQRLPDDLREKIAPATTQPVG